MTSDRHWLIEHFMYAKGVIKYEGTLIDISEPNTLHISNKDRTDTVTTWRNTNATTDELLEELCSISGWTKPWTLDHLNDLQKLKQLYPYVSLRGKYLILQDDVVSVTVYEGYNGKLFGGVTPQKVNCHAEFTLEETELTLLQIVDSLRDAADSLWGDVE